MILDAMDGLALIEPDEETIAKYKALAEKPIPALWSKLMETATERGMAAAYAKAGRGRAKPERGKREREAAPGQADGTGEGGRRAFAPGQ